MNTSQLIHVMLVDDHNVVRSGLATFLRAYEDLDLVGEAKNGLEALNLCRSKKPDVILMDLMMPEMDGFQATEKIREIEFGTGRHTPIVAVTAMSQSCVREKCLAAGLDDYISKPISREILRSKLDHWMQLTMTSIPDNYQSDAVVPLDEYPIDRARLHLLYEVDDLEPILKLFLEVTETLLGELESAIGERNVTKVAHTAHELKGSSYAVSAREMAKLSLELEHAGAEERWNEALKIHAGLAHGFLRVKEFLSKDTAGATILAREGE